VVILPGSAMGAVADVAVVGAVADVAVVGAVADVAVVGAVEGEARSGADTSDKAMCTLCPDFRESLGGSVDLLGRDCVIKRLFMPFTRFTSSDKAATCSIRRAIWSRKPTCSSSSNVARRSSIAVRPFSDCRAVCRY
jgi:hypothetical protein